MWYNIKVKQLRNQNMELTAIEYIIQASGVATLCGSTKFFFEAMEANKVLTFQNWVVLQCGSWEHSFHKYGWEHNITLEYSELQKLHLRKIAMSQLVVVVSDSSKYIDDATKVEIDFAKFKDIPVIYFDGERFSGMIAQPPVNRFNDDKFLKPFLAEGYTLGMD